MTLSFYRYYPGLISPYACWTWVIAGRLDPINVRPEISIHEFPRRTLSQIRTNVSRGSHPKDLNAIPWTNSSASTAFDERL